MIETLEQHHILPRQFIALFRDAGLNPHLFTKSIPKSLHHRMHREWNILWQVFFEQRSGEATAEEIAIFAGEIMERWGLNEVAWEVWNLTDIPW